MTGMLEGEFARFGVLAEPPNILKSLLAFTVHQWMLDEGLEADALRPITRALITLQGQDASDDVNAEESGPASLGLVGLNSGSNAGFGRSGKSGVKVKVKPGNATIEGPLDSDIVRRIVRAHINDVRDCYAEELAKHPDLSGRVALDFTIASRGNVSRSEVESNTLKDDKTVGPCIAKAAKRWRFPKPPGGEDVAVTYPFTLSPG